MLLLEDKSVISRMNKLSSEEQRNLVLDYVKEAGCNIYFEMKKKNQKDKRNFHILTESGIILRRAEFISHWSKKRWIIWFLTASGKARIQKDFGSIIYEFNKLIGELNE